MSTSQRGETIGLQVVLLSLSAVVLALRLWTRARLQSLNLGADDWTIVVAWVLALFYAIDVCLQTRYGLGYHIDDLPPTANIPLQLKLYFIKEPIYYFASALPRVSILLLYLRLSPNRTFTRTVRAMIVFVLLTALCISIAGVFQCRPIDKAWYTDKPGTCFLVELLIANAGFNIAQDVIVYLLPVRMLMGLKLPRKQRLALVLVFVMGAAVIVVSIYRIKWLKLIGTTQDPTWDEFGAALWSSVEVNVSIICASLVHFKAILTRYAPRLMGLSGRSSSSGGAVSDDNDKNGPRGPALRLDGDSGSGSGGGGGGGGGCEVRVPISRGNPDLGRIRRQQIGVITVLSVETRSRTAEDDEETVCSSNYYPGRSVAGDTHDDEKAGPYR